MNLLNKSKGDLCVIAILGGDSKYRQPEAIKLFMDLGCQRILVIGDKSFYFQNCKKNYINKFKDYYGKKIFEIYPDSKNTYGDIMCIRDILRSTNYDKIFLVTSLYHLKRVAWLIKKIFLEEEQNKILLMPCRKGNSQKKKIIESLKLIYYRIKYYAL